MVKILEVRLTISGGLASLSKWNINRPGPLMLAVTALKDYE